MTTKTELALPIASIVAAFLAGALTAVIALWAIMEPITWHTTHSLA